MRTNIDINEDLMDEAMKAGPFKTKKDAVEAGLKLLARQAAYREILKWEGKLHWDGDDEEGLATALTTGSDARRLVANSPAPTPITGKRAGNKTPKAGHGRR
ncbi:type II toxin-antitoxin system VapB family antitoxin [Variovorax sp. VNK109]|uniref:type II toxin-antitoxin system VapB family antitoxin n=1 Tax=Variovorax sp. VNK109 TaxID=3400919 RepID=UPI003C0EA814